MSRFSFHEFSFPIFLSSIFLSLRTFSLLLTLILAPACLAASPAPPAKSPGQEPGYEGKTLGEWAALAKDRDPAQRINAAGALANIGPQSVAALTELLQDKNEHVRYAAAWALWEIGAAASPAVPALTALLKDDEVKDAAAGALGGIGPEAKPAVAALTELLKDKHADVRRNAVEALGKIAPEMATVSAAVRELLGDPDERVRRTARSALEKIDPKAAPVGQPKFPGQEPSYEGKTLSEWRAMAKGGDPAQRSYAVGVLARIGPLSVATLTEMLNHENSDDRWVFVHGLEVIGPRDKAVVPALTGLLRDKDLGLRVYAAEVLAKFGPEAYDALGPSAPEAQIATQALLEMFKEKENWPRRAAMRALSQIGPGAKAALPQIEASLNDKFKDKDPARGSPRPRPWETSVRGPRSRSPPSRNCSRTRTITFGAARSKPLGRWGPRRAAPFRP